MERKRSLPSMKVIGWSRIYKGYQDGKKPEDRRLCF